MELPLICKRKLNQTEILAISQISGKFVEEWKKAAGAPDAVFNNLPPLDKTQFATFYKAVYEGMPEQPDAVKASEAEAKADDLLTVVNFSDSNLTKASWLEFWVYMCNAGIKPEENEYKQKAAGEGEFDKFMKAKLMKDVTKAAANNRPGFGQQAKKKRRSARRKFRKEI